MTKRKCLICGCLYNYCTTCRADRFKPAWYQIFCSEECKEIDEIISANSVGAISDIEAKHKLEEVKLFGKEFNKKVIEDKIDYLLTLDEPKEEKEINEKENTLEEENVKDEINIEDSLEKDDESKENEDSDSNDNDNREINNVSESKQIRKNYSKRNRSNKK